MNVKKIVNVIASFFLGVLAFFIGRHSAKETLDKCMEVQEGWKETEEKCKQMVKESEERLEEATLIKQAYEEMTDKFIQEKHEYEMKKIEEKHNEKMKELEQLERRNSERLENAKTLDEQLETFEANRKDISNITRKLFSEEGKGSKLVFGCDGITRVVKMDSDEIIAEEPLLEN